VYRLPATPPGSDIDSDSDNDNDNESMNQSSKLLFFLDCFRNVSCVSADGGGSTDGVQPSKQLLFA